MEVPKGSASSLRFEEVTKVYPGSSRPALNRVSLAVEPGRFVVVLGASGSGKTTLLKLVNRLIEPTSGRVLVDDQPVDSLPAPQLRRRIGYVIQQVGLFPHMRVEANIAVVPKLLGWETKRISHRVDDLLDLVGLPPDQYRRRYPGQLSGGEQQRVGLARALAANPTILLMDEPFGALDAVTRTRLQEELLGIHARLGQTVLFVTHDVEEAIRLADRLVVMWEGSAVQYGEPAEIVLKPANPFVSDLVGSRDPWRRLSLLPVRTALQTMNGRRVPEGPTVQLSENLRTALALLLESRASEIVVLDAGQHPIGTISLGSILAATRPAGPSGSFERHEEVG